MRDTPDTSPTRVEGEKPPEYTPAKDPTMRRVIISEVINHQGEDVELGSIGYTTDIRGAKVPLEQLDRYNKTTADVHATPSSGEPPYKVGYFKTHSGNVYQFRNLEDETWVVESAKSPMQLNINGAC